ncbi:hypothetical protein ACFLUO_08515 [Chloroflexota bacterium]
MKKHVKKLLVLFLGIAMLCSIVGCSQAQSNPASKPLPWIEYDGLFETKDLERAQGEIPFNILLPDYISNEENQVPLPSIRGPLRESQSSGEIVVEILYFLDPTQDNSGLIIITESERPIDPADSENIIEINGKSVVQWNGNFSLGPGFFFFFEDSGIYFVVELYYISYDESIKILESMIKQAK